MHACPCCKMAPALTCLEFATAAVWFAEAAPPPLLSPPPSLSQLSHLGCEQRIYSGQDILLLPDFSSCHNPVKALSHSVPTPQQPGPHRCQLPTNSGTKHAIQPGITTYTYIHLQQSLMVWSENKECPKSDSETRGGADTQVCSMFIGVVAHNAMGNGGIAMCEQIRVETSGNGIRGLSYEPKQLLQYSAASKHAVPSSTVHSWQGQLQSDHHF